MEMDVYDWYQVVDHATGNLLGNATGFARLAPGGAAVQVYAADTGQPLDRLVTNPKGVGQQFSAAQGGVPLWIDFGVEGFWLWPKNLLDNASRVPSIEQSAQQAVAAAQQAAADAQAASQKAQLYGFTKDQVVADVLAQIPTTSTSGTTTPTTDTTDYTALKAAMQKQAIAGGMPL